MDSADWIDAHAIPVDPAIVTVADERPFHTIDERLVGARIVLLGETNHFVREKVDFRLFWMERIMRALS